MKHLQKTLMIALATILGMIFSVSNSLAMPECSSSGYKNNCYGISILSNGDKYKGEWKDNKVHGHGAWNYGYGNKYVGQFKDNKRNGQGTYTYSNGDKYEGKWKDNKAHGQGTYTFGKRDDNLGKLKYGKFNGEENFTYVTREKYQGQFKDVKKHGQFTFTKANGDKYLLEYKDNKVVKSTASRTAPLSDIASDKLLLKIMEIIIQSILYSKIGH
jgi:hypothetical protein